MAFVFRHGDLPKLDLQVDWGDRLQSLEIPMGGLHQPVRTNHAGCSQAGPSPHPLFLVTIIDNLGLTATQRGKVEDIVVAMEHYVNGQINESVERRTFRRRTQQPGESFDDFLVSLRELAKTCNFCDDRCTQKNIQDQIINGYFEGDTVEDLLAEKDLTLEKTVTKCRAQEAAKRQRAEMAGTGGAAIQAVRRYQTPTYRQQTPTYNQVGKTCQGCGASPHQGGRRQCPAFNATCKWRFAQASVGFAGFTLSADGYRIDQSITEAISSFPTPASRTDLRSFFGLANQLSASTATVAELLAPLRPLLSTKNDFTWSPALDQAFVTAKKSITSAPTLAFFDLRKPTRLCTDASHQGLGFVLQQKSGESWVLIQAGSRFLSDTESRYAVIELELLAVSWAILKCRIFLAGLPHFSVVTDHYPLISILNNYRLDEIENPRLQRLKTKVMAFNFTAEWIKGTLNNAPDALS